MGGTGKKVQQAALHTCMHIHNHQAFSIHFKNIHSYWNYQCKHNIGNVLERGIMLPGHPMVSITANRLYRVQLRIVLGSSASNYCGNCYKFSAVLCKVCDMMRQHFTLECIYVCWFSCHTANHPSVNCQRKYSGHALHCASSTIFSLPCILNCKLITTFKQHVSYWYTFFSLTLPIVQ